MTNGNIFDGNNAYDNEYHVKIENIDGVKYDCGKLSSLKHYKEASCDDNEGYKVELKWDSGSSNGYMRFC